MWHLLLAAPSFHVILLFWSPFYFPFWNRFAWGKKHKHTNFHLALPQSYLWVLSRHSCTPLYALTGLGIRRACEKAVYQISSRGAHCCNVHYHHLSVLQCHSRAKELRVVFAQLLYLHARMLSLLPAKSLIKWIPVVQHKSPSFYTWTSSMPASRRNSRLVSPFFLVIVSDKNCIVSLQAIW